MSRRAVAAATVLVVGWALLFTDGLARGGGSSAAPGDRSAAGAPSAQPGETIRVPNTQPVSKKSRTVLDPVHRYRLVATGRVSDWANAPEDGFGVDAIWCYAKWRCGSGLAWRQLRVKRAADEWGASWGQGLDEFAGTKLPYDGKGHRYEVQVSGVAGRLEFATWDAFVLKSLGDNKGSFTVTITDLGPVGAQAKVTFSISQNGLPLEPRQSNLVHSQTTGRGTAFLKITEDRGRGVLDPDLNERYLPRGGAKATGSITHVDTRLVAGKRVTRRFVIQLFTTSWYRSAPRQDAVNRVLMVIGKVTSSTDPGCPAGRAALLTIRDYGGEDGLNVILQNCQSTHRSEQFEVTRENRIAVNVSKMTRARGA